MEAIGLFFTKFSDELLSAQIAMLSFCLALGVYWMLVRKKKRETSEWVPAALVKAYLDRMRADEYDTRVRLFGESQAYMPAGAGQPSLTQTLAAAAPAADDGPSILRRPTDGAEAAAPMQVAPVEAAPVAAPAPATATRSPRGPRRRARRWPKPHESPCRRASRRRR